MFVLPSITPKPTICSRRLIASHSAPKKLAVVSSDRRVQAAARRRGSLALDSQQWLDDLLDGKVRLAVDRAQRGRAGE